MVYILKPVITQKVKELRGHEGRNGKIIRRGRDSHKNYGIRIIIIRVITFLNSKPVFGL
jgi:hypothetical protein